MMTVYILWAVFSLELIGAQDCGVDMKTRGRIVGGEDVIGYRPWYCLLHEPGDKSSPLCSGSLIDNQHVLTAAHCFAEVEGKNNTQKFRVTIGITDRCVNETTQTTFNITKVVIHPNYTTPDNNYDIAIITLNETTHHTPICLPEKENENLTNRIGEIIGFGETVEGNESTIPCKLQMADLQIFSNGYCFRYIPEYNSPLIFCAGVVDGGVDSCQGDSGGPLQIIDKGAYVLAGIVSYGFGCGNADYPGIYTKVDRFLDWIKINT